MFKYISVSIIFLLGFSNVSPVYSNEALDKMDMIGLTVQEKLRIPIFFAAIYANDFSQKSELFNVNKRIRMEARFTVNQFSARQNSRHWLELILVNNSKEAVSAVSKSLMQFRKLTKIDVVKGDRLVFDYVPQKGTRLFINNVLIGEIKDPQFKPILTAAWLGYSLSTANLNISHNRALNEQLVAEFNALNINPNRAKQLRARVAANHSSQNKTIAVTGF